MKKKVKIILLVAILTIIILIVLISYFFRSDVVINIDKSEFNSGETIIFNIKGTVITETNNLPFIIEDSEGKIVNLEPMCVGLVGRGHFNLCENESYRQEYYKKNINLVGCSGCTDALSPSKKQFININYIWSQTEFINKTNYNELPTQVKQGRYKVIVKNYLGIHYSKTFLIQ